ncbi:MAG: phospholipase D-like domain-containing protein [Akkermansiaceae bacterium]
MRNRDGGALSEGNRLEVYFLGDSAFDAMRQEIEGAKRSVHMEIYIFMADEAGQSFAEALGRKAEEGLDVRVVYDSFGSHRAGRRQFDEMRKRGVAVAEYRPYAPWRLFGRNHRKLLVVDGRVAFTGGMNLADTYSARESGEEAWRDTHMRVEGPAARDCDVLFGETWRIVTDEELAEPPAFSWAEGESGCCSCLVVGSRGLKRRRVMRRLFSVHIGRARRVIQLTVPYFSPPRRLRRALEKAREREVKVELLIPEFTDVPIADWIRERLMPEFLEMGLTIREYHESVLHAKTMAVDGDLAVVGSTNYDYLSIALNLELSIVVYDRDFASRLVEQYEKDLERATPVDLERAKQRRWWQKMVARLAAFLVRRL